MGKEFHVEVPPRLSRAYCIRSIRTRVVFVGNETAEGGRFPDLPCRTAFPRNTQFDAGTR